MEWIVSPGRTSKILGLFILDSSRTDGGGLTGLVFNSSGLIAYYWREGDATATAISLVTATDGSWVSGGFVERDAVHQPGHYDFHLPNAALAAAAGVDSVQVHLQGAANMVPLPLNIQLGQAGIVVASLVRSSRVVSLQAPPPY